MKKNLLVAFALVLGCIVPAYALDTVRVNIPFDFTVGNTTLPAGEYRIVPSGLQGGTLIRGVDGQGSALAFATSAVRLAIPEGLTQERLENSVVFHKYGDRYFISQVWTGLSGREFYQSRTEREIKTARIPSNHETIVLAAVIR